MKIIKILSDNRITAINVIFILLIPTLIFSVTGLLNIQYYVFEIFTSFSFQFFVAAIVYLVITLLTFEYKYKYFYTNISLCTIIIALNAGSIIPLYLHKTFQKIKTRLKFFQQTLTRSTSLKNRLLKVF